MQLKDKIMFRLACGLYDQLEIFAMRKTLVDICFINEEGDEFIETGVIADLISKNGIESVIINNKTINTRDLISVNGVDYKSIE